MRSQPSHGVDDSGSGWTIPTIPQIDLVDDFTHEAQARVLEPKAATMVSNVHRLPDD